MSLKEILDTYIPQPKCGQPFRMHVEPGIYVIRNSLSENNFPKPMKGILESDEIFVFRDSAAQELRKEIRSFWSMGKRFQESGFLHKRGLLVVGPPGSGKTTLLRQEAEHLVKAGQVVFFGKSPWSLSESIENFRRMEKHRPLTVIIEDIDEVSRGYGLQDLLEMLDGTESTNKVLFIGTTNNPENMPPKLKRPGRFDRRIYIDNPEQGLREDYISRKFSKLKLNFAEIAKKTEGFSFGDLRELIVSYSAYKTDLDETIKRIRNDKKESEGGSKDNPYGSIPDSV